MTAMRAAPGQSVCVIGAGMSGLAAIRALVSAGQAVTAYEAGSSIGGMWRYGNDSGLSAAYESLQANTSRRRMQYPGLPMADVGAEYPLHTDILAYLDTYTDVHDLSRHITFRAPVTRVERAPGGWEVTVSGCEPRRFAWVVVATGHYCDPVIPELPGEFSGLIMHARDYRAPGRFAGQRVVVVGGAQSALDIVAEISTTARHTFLACAGGHHLIPRRVLGRPLDAFDTSAALLMPLPVVRSGVRAMMRLGRAIPDRGSLPPPNHRLFESRWPVVVSPLVSTAISARAFETRPHLNALAGDRVMFSDGTAEQIDVIVFATGYRISFPFLPDRLGLGTGWEFPLYRRILSPH